MRLRIDFTLRSSTRRAFGVAAIGCLLTLCRYAEAEQPEAMLQGVYEAELGRLSGDAAVIGAADATDRTVGDLGGEASHRQAVVLKAADASVAWPIERAQHGANAIVLRFSLPDAPQGGGSRGSLEVTVEDGNEQVRERHVLQLDSRYAWLYGGVMDGTKLFNTPADAVAYGTAATSTHLYDEVQLKLRRPLHSGEWIRVSKTADNAAAWIAVDFIELETVPEALPKPRTHLSLASPECGALAVDLRGSNSVFDGADDSSYASVFHAALGKNPNNPIGFGILEKDYYSSGPEDDLQDTRPNAGTHGLSMFELADHNFKSLQRCIALVASSAGRYKGVWIPAGRFYARGLLQLPDDARIEGAGMWYSKFASVDTAAPEAVTVRGVTGIASQSGNLVFSSQGGGAAHVRLANFSIFGNVTQRDVVDAVLPFGIHGEFVDSEFESIWVEHEFIGINTNLDSARVRIVNARVRDTFADGIDFYGSTRDSRIVHSSVRSTGDDGFALWSQGATLDGISQSNSIEHSLAQLQWYGDGFAIYGGNDESISQSVASDILNYPCLQVSTQFVPAALPSTASMSAHASDLVLIRCGGDGFKQKFGALLIGTYLENVDGVTFDHIRIIDPTYRGIDIRPIPAPSSHTVVATLDNANVSDVDVVGAPQCATVAADMGGSAAFDGVCQCAAIASVSTSCAVSNASSKTFQVQPSYCAASVCGAL